MAKDKRSYSYGISRGKARIGESDLVVRHLLRKEGSAVGNSAVQSHRSEIGAVDSLALRPLANSRSKRTRERPKPPHHPKVNADDRQIALVVALLRA